MSSKQHLFINAAPVVGYSRDHANGLAAPGEAPLMFAGLARAS